MLTGDALPVAREIARELGLGEIVRAPDLQLRRRNGGARRRLVEGSSGFAEVFPEDKFLVVKRLQAAGHVVGMTGDGVNDAPGPAPGGSRHRRERRDRCGQGRGQRRADHRGPGAASSTW